MVRREHAGYIAQMTSVPGVAQRTGATNYYVELFPKTGAKSNTRAPVLGLTPVAGDVDIVIASELMEAGRAVQRGLVTPDKTTFIVSTNRVYSMTERIALADGRVDPTPLLSDANPRSLQRTLDALASAVAVGRADLVIANTLSTYWGVHLARRAGVPVIFYIHESTPPRSFFRGFVPPTALSLAEEAIGLADRVSFLTATSQRYFDGLANPDNFVRLPGWINLSAVDRYCSTHTHEAEKARLGIAAERKLVINVGTVCDRKGQHLFARAVDLLWQLSPTLAANTEFLMVGGGDTAYDRELADFLVELNRPNLRVVPGTREVYPYYRAADLFVCSSYEESFPRVILEAMAMNVPILSTNVHGIPEIVRPEKEALLVAPGDSSALTLGLQRLLGEPRLGRHYATQARLRLEENFDAAILLPRHLAFLRAVHLARATGK